MDYVDFIVTVFNKPTYFVFGNHNLNEYHFYHRSSPIPSGGITSHYNDVSHAHGATYAGFKTFVDSSLCFTDPVTGTRTPLLIAGASGSSRYNKGLCQFTDLQMKLKLIKMIPKLILNKIKYGRYLDIFLTHATPRNFHDHEDPCHIGFPCYNWFLEKFKPTYMVHGHIHLYDSREERIGTFCESTVVNAYAHCVIELPPKITTQENDSSNEL